jgi:hypothetical protein
MEVEMEKESKDTNRLNKPTARPWSLVQNLNMRDLGSRKPYLQKGKLFSHLFEHNLHQAETHIIVVEIGPPICVSCPLLEEAQTNEERPTAEGHREGDCQLACPRQTHGPCSQHHKNPDPASLGPQDWDSPSSHELVTDYIAEILGMDCREI